MQSVVHTINLFQIGGVQQMFVPFYQYAREKSRFRHKVFGLYDIDKEYVGVDIYKNLHRSFFHKCEYMYHLLSHNSVVHLHNMLGGRRLNRYLKIIPASHVIFSEQGVIWNISSRDCGVCFNNAHKAQMIIANSHATKIMLHKKIGVPQNKIRVVHNGFLDHTPSIEKSSTQKKVIGFIGRLEAFKGIHILIKSAQLLSDCHNIVFKIAGNGQYEDELKRMAEGYGNIEFVGRVDKPLQFIASVDVLVVPSIREPFGNVLVEAGFCKKAVIASFIDGIPEIIENGRSGILLRPTKDISLHHFPLLPECVVDPTTNELVKPRELDPQELAETIRTLIEDEKRMRTFGMNLYEAVKGRFTLQAYGNQLEAIYEEVLRV